MGQKEVWPPWSRDPAAPQPISILYPIIADTHVISGLTIPLFVVEALEGPWEHREKAKPKSWVAPGRSTGPPPQLKSLVGNGLQLGQPYSGPETPCPACHIDWGCLQVAGPGSDWHCFLRNLPGSPKSPALWDVLVPRTDSHRTCSLRPPACRIPEAPTGPSGQPGRGH